MIELLGQKQDVDALVFSPDGQELVVAGTASRVQLWDLATNQARAILGPKGPHRAVAFVAEGRLVAATGKQGSVRISDTRREHTTTDAKTGHNYLHAAATKDGAAVVLVGQRGWARYLECRRVPDLELVWGSNGEQLDDVPFRVCSLPDGRMVVATIYRATLLDPATGEIGERVASYAQAVPALAVSPDGKLLAIAAGMNLVVYELGTRVRLGDVHNGGRKHFTDVAFHPSGRQLMASSNNETVRVYDVATMAESAAFDWQVGPVRRVAFAPDGMRAAAAGKTGRVVVWDVDW